MIIHTIIIIQTQRPSLIVVTHRKKILIELVLVQNINWHRVPCCTSYEQLHDANCPLNNNHYSIYHILSGQVERVAILKCNAPIHPLHGYHYAMEQ